MGSGMPILTAIYPDFFGQRAMGSIFGFSRISWGIGAAIGPLLAGYIYDVTLSYYLAFLLYAILFIMAIVSTILLRAPARAQKKIKKGKKGF